MKSGIHAKGIIRAASLVVLLSGSADVLCAQQAPSAASTAAVEAGSSVSSSLDANALATEVRASYYHSDQLDEMNCTAVLDWAGVFRQLHTPVTPERLKALQGMTVVVLAAREKSPQITIAWPDTAPAGSESIESGIKQMLGGFFQTYWPFADSSIVPAPSDNPHVEARSGGGSALKFSGGGTTVIEEVNSDHVLTKIAVDSPAMKATMEPHFSPSPVPKAGDLRRFTSMDASDEIGASTIKVKIALDYQSIGDFNIPRHISVELNGAYAIPIELTGCTVKGK